MGIDIRPINPNGVRYHSTYGAYFALRCLIAHSYNAEIGDMFERVNVATEDDVKRWNAICNDDLDLLLLHPDDSGVLNPEECRKIIAALNKIDFHIMDGYCVELFHDLYADLIATLEYAVENNEILYFS